MTSGADVLTKADGLGEEHTYGGCFDKEDSIWHAVSAKKPHNEEVDFFEKERKDTKSPLCLLLREAPASQIGVVALVRTIQTRMFDMSVPL
jgi:hypothetical protein